MLVRMIYSSIAPEYTHNYMHKLALVFLRSTSYLKYYESLRIFSNIIRINKKIACSFKFISNQIFLMQKPDINNLK